MILEGDSSVIKAIKEKKKLSDDGKPHEHINPLLIIDGGLMKGVYGAGAVMAMTELKVVETFTAVVGVSAGAVTAAYALADDVPLGASMMWEELCTKQFWNPWNLRSPLNTGFVKDILIGKTGKRLKNAVVLSHSVPFYIGLSHYQTAQPTLFLPKNHEELIMGIQASISMPGAATEKVCINGVRYVDGASTIPHIVEHAVTTLPASHILIITNQDKDTASIPFFEKFLSSTLLRLRFSRALLRASNQRRETRHQFLAKFLQNSSVPTSVIWGNGKIGSFERNAAKIKATIEESRQWWLNLLT